MDQLSINLLDSEPTKVPPAPLQPVGDHTPHPPRRRTALLVGAVFFVVASTFLIANVVVPSVRLTSQFGTSGFWSQLKHLVFSSDRALPGADEDRVNVLLLGIGGTGHDGPLLTDTVMVASFQPSTGRAALLSLPRDLWIRYPNGTSRKINEIYNEGEKHQPGSGGEYAAALVGDVTGLKITYYVLVDFSGFKQIIDEVGEVHVNVPKAFSDATFPTDDGLGGTQAISFSAGWQWMDGERALMYARSRHGTNGEGSDFRRIQRHQQILLAIKDRVLSSSTLLNPVKVNALASQLSNHLVTNLEPWELLTLYSMGHNVGESSIIRHAFDASPKGELTEGTSSAGAYILLPKGGDYSRIREVAENIFDTATTEPTATRPRIEVQNGTNVSGLAATAGADLERLGFTVVNTRNADNRPVTKTVLYDLTAGRNPAALATLQRRFPAEVTTSVPTWLQASAAALDPSVAPPKTVTVQAAEPTQTDFILILGTDAAPQPAA